MVARGDVLFRPGGTVPSRYILFTLLVGVSDRLNPPGFLVVMESGCAFLTLGNCIGRGTATGDAFSETRRVTLQELKSTRPTSLEMYLPTRKNAH